MPICMHVMSLEAKESAYQVIVAPLQIHNLDSDYLIKWNAESSVHCGTNTFTNFLI